MRCSVGSACFQSLAALACADGRGPGTPLTFGFILPQWRGAPAPVLPDAVEVRCTARPICRERGGDPRIAGGAAHSTRLVPKGRPAVIATTDREDGAGSASLVTAVVRSSAKMSDCGKRNGLQVQKMPTGLILPACVGNHPLAKRVLPAVIEGSRDSPRRKLACLRDRVSDCAGGDRFGCRSRDMD